MKNVQRLVSMLLVLAMAVGFLPQTAWAEDTVTEAVLPLEEILQTTEAAEVMEVTEAPTTEATDPPETTEAPTTETTDPPETTEAPTTEATDPPETTEAPTTEATDPPETTEAPATEPVETTVPTEPTELPPVADDVANATSGTCGTGVEWSYADGVLTISGSGWMDDYCSYHWSSYREEITSVVIQSGVTGIGAQAFGGLEMANISIPDSVTWIGEAAFQGCSGLTGIDLPENLTSIESNLFYGCSSLESITIPGSVANIGNYAFQYCSSLFSVELTDGLTGIGSCAFYECTSLASITIPDSVTHVGDSAFYNCSNLQSATLPDSLTGIVSGTFMLCSSLTAMDIPNGVSSIGANAFYGCENLQSVALPDSLISIGNSAFYNCRNLTGVTLPKGLTHIDNYAFNNCQSLESIVIPKGVTSIGYRTFAYCSNLESVTLLGEVTSIGNYAFNLCTDLTTINFPHGLTSIGNNAFDNCTSLGNIVFPETLRSIGASAFNNCKYRELNIVIPNSVTSIGDKAFAYCQNLKSIQLSKNLTSLGKEAFYSCSKLEGIIIPAGITDIADGTFQLCQNLKDVTIQKGITSIGKKAFQDCRTLENLVIPDSVTSIGEYAFNNCYLLERITIPGSVSTVANYAFYGCKGLKSAAMQTGVTTVGTNVFYNCTALTNLLIPDTITSISSSAFGYCKSLREVYYQGSESQWEDIAIAGGNAYLTSANIYYHFNGNNVEDVENIHLTNLSIICKANKKDPENEKEDFELCPGVQAYVGDGGIHYISDEKGQITISGSIDDSVTFEKEGYRTRTIPLAALRVDNVVYLQQATDYPAVNALWIGNTDILHRAFQMEYASEEEFILIPEVDWGDSSMQSLSLYQEGRTLSLTEGSNSVQLAKYFDINEKIRLVATNAEVKTTQKELQIENSLIKVLDGFSFELGDGLNFTLPDDLIWPLGGMDMKVGLYSRVPVEFCMEDGKFYAAIGYQNGAEWDEVDGKEVKSFANSVKDLKEKWSDFKSEKELYKVYNDIRKQYGEKLANIAGSVGFDGNFSIMGYVEGYVDGDGNIIVTDEGGIMVFSASVDYTKPFLLGPAPMFFEFGIKGDLQTQLHLYINQKIKEFTPRLEIKGIFTPNGGVGTGLPKILSASIGLKGVFTNTLNLDQGKIEYYQFKAALEWYVKAKIIWGTFDWGDVMGEKIVYEYPTPRSVLALAQAEDSGGRPDLYDISQYTIDDLSYLSYGSPFMGGGASPFALRSFRAPFVSNAYEGADPKTASFSDGTRLAVWVGYNESHSGPDALNLYYSYYNGNWSQPQVVEDDGTSDAYPDLKVINDVAYVTWQDASQSLVGTDDVAAAAAYMDISAAVFDPQTNTFTASTLTTNSALDMQPKLCGSGSTVYVVWHRNGANDWFGQNQANALLFSRCTGGSWSGENTLYSGLNPLVDFDVCCSGGNLCVAYSMDTDGDLNTTQDVEVYENGSRQTENDWLDSGVTYCGGDLYWYSGGKLLLWGSDTMAEGVFIGSDRFQVLDANGVRAMVYAEENGLASILYAAYYDAASDCWGSPIVLYDAGTSIASFSASVTPEGEISVLIQNQEVAEVFDGTDPYGLVTLDWYNAPLGCNIRVDDVRYYNENYVLNKDMPVYITVTNSGELAVQQLLVELLDEESAVVQQWTLDQQLLSGQKAELEVLYRVKEVVQDKTLTFRVTPIGKEETDTTDNTGEMTLGWNDLSVESVRYGRLSGGDIVIHASIVNRGYEAQENITVRLIRDTPGGTEADSCTVEKIEAFSLQNVSFTVEETEDCVYYVCIDHKEADKNYANDSEFVLLDIQSGDDAPWQIDETTGFVLGIPAGTPTETVLAAFRSGDTEVSVTTPDGAPADTVGTGWILNIGESSYTIAALGDTDGNGLVNIRDLYDILDHADGRTLLTGLPFQAARVCRLQTVTEADVDATANHILTGSFGN